MDNSKNDKNKKSLNWYEFLSAVEQRIKFIGIKNIDSKSIKKAYNRMLTVNDTVSSLI